VRIPRAQSSKYHRVESFYGSFERSFSLPENVNADAIRCEGKDGISQCTSPRPRIRSESRSRSTCSEGHATDSRPIAKGGHHEIRQ
jgi:HSP20 family molecular chaperone IbpA